MLFFLSLTVFQFLDARNPPFALFFFLPHIQYTRTRCFVPALSCHPLPFHTPAGNLRRPARPKRRPGAVGQGHPDGAAAAGHAHAGAQWAARAADVGHERRRGRVCQRRFGPRHPSHFVEPFPPFSVECKLKCFSSFLTVPELELNYVFIYLLFDTLIASPSKQAWMIPRSLQRPMAWRRCHGCVQGLPNA